MSIFKSAYDTLACHGFMMASTIKAIEAVKYSGHLAPAAEGMALYQLQGGVSIADHVPAFAHPIVMGDPHRPGEENNETVVIDVRPYGRFDSIQQRYVVKNRVEYDFLRQRGRLNTVWVKGGILMLSNIGSLPMEMFSSWIAENVARRFALDPREQMRLKALAALYYATLFQETKRYEEADINAMTARVVRSIRLPAETVYDVAKQYLMTDEVTRNLTQFASVAADICDSVRLKELSAGMLIAVLGKTWFSTTGAEMCAVALEHPPTWLAMIYMASVERSYHNSSINQLLERTDRKDKGQQYRYQLMSILNQTW